MCSEVGELLEHLATMLAGVSPGCAVNRDGMTEQFTMHREYSRTVWALVLLLGNFFYFILATVFIKLFHSQVFGPLVLSFVSFHMDFQ